MKCLMRLVCLCGLLLLMSACSAMYAGKFEVEITPTENGAKYHVVTTKNYGSIKATGTKNKAGDIEFEITAEKVDATTLAAKTIEAQSGVISALAGIVGVVQ